MKKNWRKKSLTGNGWKNLTSWLQTLNMRNLLPSFSGLPDLKYSYVAIFFIISIIGVFEKLESGDHILYVVSYSGFFFSLGLSNLLIKSNYTGMFSNLILAIAVIVLVPYGDLTAMLFLIFIAYKIEIKKQYYILLSISFIAIVLNGNYQGNSVLQLSAILVGYLFFTYCYYDIIHIPTSKLKKENETLKIKLSIVGDAKHLTDDQILHYYPVMKHQDYDMKYSKINIIRDFSDGITRTKLAKKYDCSSKTIDRYLSEMKEEFGAKLNIKISENTHLVKIAAMLDIVQVIVRQKEY